MFASLDQCIDPDPRSRDLQQDWTDQVSELGEVHKLIAPLLGSGMAPTLFRDRIVVLWA
jgi:hypothetical protein